MLRFVVALLVLPMLYLPVAEAQTPLEYNKGFALSATVDDCSLVFVGRVKNLEGVWRDNIPSEVTTDVTVEVKLLIKGTPNINPTTARFMIEGGTATNPATGKEATLYLTGEPHFHVGDKGVFFLTKMRDPYFKNYPYDRLSPYRGVYGAPKIENEAIFLVYLLSDSDPDEVKFVKMPLDIVVNLSKVGVKNKVELEKLETLIKAEMIRADTSIVGLSDNFKTEMQTKSLQVIERLTTPTKEEEKP